MRVTPLSLAPQPPLPPLPLLRYLCACACACACELSASPNGVHTRCTPNVVFFFWLGVCVCELAWVGFCSGSLWRMGPSYVRRTANISICVSASCRTHECTRAVVLRGSTRACSSSSGRSSSVPTRPNANIYTNRTKQAQVKQFNMSHLVRARALMRMNDAHIVARVHAVSGP